MLLIFDTETTGVNGKPKIVQLAFILAEEDGTPRASCDLIIKPDGYEIPEEASRIHGITTEMATRCGVPLAVGIAAFNNAALACAAEGGKLIGHNLQFDVRMIRNAYEIGGWPNRVESLRHFCTMEAMRDRVKIPPTPKMISAGRMEFKSPKLSEAYEFAFNKKLENAHNALHDVNACKEIYLWILAGGNHLG